MEILIWIICGGLLMSAIAMIGGVSIALPAVTVERLLLPFVSLAAGTLLGGAFFHMIPEGNAVLPPLQATLWLMLGFTVFLGLEQFLQWHHSHRRVEQNRKPVTYLILIGDAIHNFLGGIGIASTFLINPKAGIIAWLAAAAHEVPQELGDFGILVHGGWPRKRALLWNFVSALTFPLGALLAYFTAQTFEVAGFVLFAAGNFIYIAASDLIPEIKQQTGWGQSLLHFSLFAIGLGAMYVLAFLFQH